MAAKAPRSGAAAGSDIESTTDRASGPESDAGSGAAPKPRKTSRGKSRRKAKAAQPAAPGPEKGEAGPADPGSASSGRSKTPKPSKSPKFPRPVVSSLGPLSDPPARQIRGRTGPEGGRVTLCVNDHPVIRTSAHDHGKTAGQFFFSCTELADYLGDGDRISVHDADGRAIPIRAAGSDPEFTVATGTPSRFADLRAKLDEGHVFTKFGTLKEGWTPARRAAVRGLFDAAAAALDADFGLVLVPAYGNLLGAIREGGFIEHDAGLFDVSYLSAHATPGDVTAEALAVFTRLHARGFRSSGSKGAAVYVAHPDFKGVKLDFNWAWFDPAGEFNLSMGSRYDKCRDRAAYEAPRTARLDDWELRVPGNAEAVLVQLYGENWITPDQGHRAGAPLTRDPRYSLDEAQMAQLTELRARQQAQAKKAPPRDGIGPGYRP